MDRELRELWRAASQGDAIAQGRFATIVDRLGIRRCNCEAMHDIGPDHSQVSCWDLPNLNTSTIAGPLCNFCIALIPTEFHEYNCRCSNCLNLTDQ